MNIKDRIFKHDKGLIGMLHVGSPGAPLSRESPREAVDRAVVEARVLRDAGFDALIIENMHDRPYVRGSQGPEVVATMTSAAIAVRAAVPELPLGVQVLAGANAEAMAVAHASGGTFIRCEGFVFAQVADEGLMADADAPSLLRYRREIGAEGIGIFCDIKKKHSSHAITSDVTLAQTAHGAEFFGADGVIITGDATGHAADPGDIEAVRSATDLPILVGSGCTPANMAMMLRHADGVIVGSWCKVGGQWQNPIDPDRCRQLGESIEALRA